jgi:DUF3047 family protein
MTLKHRRFLAAMLLALISISAQSDAAAPHPVTLSPADLKHWLETRFKGATVYRAEDGGRGQVLHAIANGTASGLCQKVQIDLKALPILRWSWRLDRAPAQRNERAQDGDDQRLRLGLLYESGEDEESILSVQYVWSQSEPRVAIWPNPFIATARQIAVRSGPAQPGTWHVEQRDAQADFRTAFGHDVDRVDAVCVMTDGDQTGALVEAWYGDITFQSR